MMVDIETTHWSLVGVNCHVQNGPCYLVYYVVIVRLPSRAEARADVTRLYLHYPDSTNRLDCFKMGED